MRREPPAPPQLVTHAGLACALFLPDGAASGGVVIHHGAGSAKESHFDFARAARARGLAAVAFDARGHGRSGGRFGPSAVEDMLAVCELLGDHAPRLAVRGSSLGGCVSILAAAACAPRSSRASGSTPTAASSGCQRSGSRRRPRDSRRAPR